MTGGLGGTARLPQSFLPSCLSSRPRRPVSRVLSSLLTARGSHSSGTRVAARLSRPTRTTGRKCPWPRRLHARPAVPIRSCSRWGLPCRPCYQGRGALLPHRFTLAVAHGFPWEAGGLFSVALSLGSPPPAVSRHRISVEPGLSSAPLARHSGCPAVWTPQTGRGEPSGQASSNGSEPLRQSIPTARPRRP